jgi:hypothetical protein
VATVVVNRLVSSSPSVAASPTCGITTRAAGAVANRTFPS